MDEYIVIEEIVCRIFLGFLEMIKLLVILFFITDSNHFYTEESIPCMNFRVRETPLACTLKHGRNRARNLCRPAHLSRPWSELQNFIKGSFREYLRSKSPPFEQPTSLYP